MNNRLRADHKIVEVGLSERETQTVDTAKSILNTQKVRCELSPKKWTKCLLLVRNFTDIFNKFKEGFGWIEFRKMYVNWLIMQNVLSDGSFNNMEKDPIPRCERIYSTVILRTFNENNISTYDIKRFETDMGLLLAKLPTNLQSDTKVDLVDVGDNFLLVSEYNKLEIPKWLYEEMEEQYTGEIEYKNKLIFGAWYLYRHTFELDYYGVPQRVKKYLGITHESFASPINHVSGTTYTSAFPFVDNFFGSLGFFQTVDIHNHKNTTYLMNPPPINELVLYCVLWSDEICKKDEYATTVVICAQPWVDSAFYTFAVKSDRCAYIVKNFEKRYFHKRGMDGEYKSRDFANGIVIFFQNDKARYERKIDDAYIEKLKSEWSKEF